MDFSTALATDLRLLTAGTGHHDQQFADLLGAVVDHAKVAVPSFVGLHLVLVSGHSPVRLALFEPGTEPDDIATSIEIPVPPLKASGEGTFITLYAAVAGAFVDLAADLSYILKLPDPSSGRSQAGATAVKITLDDDLRPDTTGATFTGLTDATAVNRAVGALIDRGQQPEDADGELDRRATAVGLTKAGYAAWFIETLFIADPAD